MLMPDKSTGRVVVKFVSAAHPYNAGDVAGFEPDDPYLRAILKKKWARLWDLEAGEFVKAKVAIAATKVLKGEEKKETPKEEPKGEEKKEANVEGEEKKDASAEKVKMIDTAKGGAGVRKKSKAPKK